MSETKFINGMFVKAPHANAPEFVKFKLSVKVTEFCQEMKRMSDAGELNNGYLNAEILISKKGEPYIRLDEWKPDQDKGSAPKIIQNNPDMKVPGNIGGDFNDDIPFAPYEKNHLA